MYIKDMVGDHFSEDAEFDDLDDFDYVNGFIPDDDEEEDEDEDEEDLDEDFDELDDLYVDDEDEIDESLIVNDEEIEVHFVCENCGHKWIDYISEEEQEGDIDRVCPMCGSSDVSQE